MPVKTLTGVNITQVYGVHYWTHWGWRTFCIWFSPIITLSITLELLVVFAAVDNFDDCKGMIFN